MSSSPSRLSPHHLRLAWAARLIGAQGLRELEPRISSVPWNVVECSCFRILIVSCGVWSANVHGRTPLWRAVVTRRCIVQLGLEQVAASLKAEGRQFDPVPDRSSLLA